MLVSSAIYSAMRKIGVLASGEAATASELSDGIEALQVMLRSWAAAGINVFASVKESFNLVVGSASYTWGSGGTITTARPSKVLGAYVLDSSGVSHPVDIISEDRYRQIPIKTTSGRPYAVFYHPLFPLGYLYTYPVADVIEAIWIDSLKPFTETSSFESHADEMDFPPEYQEPIVYNLATRLAPEYGKSVSNEVLGVANSSYNRLISLNASNQIQSLCLVIPATAGRSGYSINSDSYR